MVAITTKYLSQTVFSSLSFCLMPNFPMIGNQCEMGEESISGGQVTAWSLWAPVWQRSQRDELLTIKTQPSPPLPSSLSATTDLNRKFVALFWSPHKILLEAFICLKSYRRTLWALSLVQVTSIKIRTVITKYQRGQQIFRLIFSNLNKVDIYNPFLSST